MPSRRPLRRLDVRAGDGQVIVFVAISLVVLLGFAALAIDVGNAYWAQRKLQGSADAAALAGAQVLPNETSAQNVALQYSGGAGGKNVHGGLNNVQASVDLECAPVSSGCSKLNTVVVSEQASVDSFFAKVLGIDQFNIKVRAAACAQGDSYVHLIDENGPCPAGVAMQVSQTLKPNNAASVSPSGSGPTPTGTVLFQLFPPADPGCAGTPAFTDTQPLSAGHAAAVNASFLASTVGGWRWKVHYGGDSHYSPLDSGCGVQNFTISS